MLKVVTVSTELLARVCEYEADPAVFLGPLQLQLDEPIYS